MGTDSAKGPPSAGRQAGSERGAKDGDERADKDQRAEGKDARREWASTRQKGRRPPAGRQPASEEPRMVTSEQTRTSGPKGRMPAGNGHRLGKRAAVRRQAGGQRATSQGW